MTGFIHITATEQNDGTALESHAELKHILLENKAQILAAILGTIGIDISTPCGIEQTAVLIALIKFMKRAEEFTEESFGFRF